MYERDENVRRRSINSKVENVLHKRELNITVGPASSKRQKSGRANIIIIYINGSDIFSSQFRLYVTMDSTDLRQIMPKRY